MEKNYKLALALLYLLQLMIVFRESVAEAYKHAVEAIHGEVELAAMDVSGHHGATVTQEERRKPSEEREPRIEHGATALAAFVLFHAVEHGDGHHALHHDNHSHPETEDETKRMRRRRWREILLANLFPSQRRFAEPAQTAGVPAFMLLRPTGFPAA